MGLCCETSAKEPFFVSLYLQHMLKLPLAYGINGTGGLALEIYIEEY